MNKEIYGYMKPTVDAAAFRKARENAGLKQDIVAHLIHRKVLTVSNWENGKQEIDPGLYELFLIKTGQHNLYGEKPKLAEDHEEEVI